MKRPDYEVIIVGGGIAGLSAALVLGRCRRRTLVCDSGKPRNARSRGLHGFLSRDGTDPWEMRRLGHEQLKAYPDVAHMNGKVVDAWCRSEGFDVALEDGRRFSSRILLLATGVVDHLPEVEGIEDFYGRSVLHCPYCDGWEQRDRPLAVYGRGEEGVLFALELLIWSRDLVLCTDGDALGIEERRRLQRHGIALREERLVRLEGEGELLERLVFAEGEPLARSALFFLPEQSAHSPLASRLGCAVNDGVSETGSLQQTSVPGLYMAGDAARSVKLAIVAAAEGAQAAFAINTALQKADLH
jgi:thioredoxin reductase